MEHEESIEEAKRRLERTDASIEEISWRVGYEDAACFRRLFKRTYGAPPATWRKGQRDASDSMASS